MGTLLTNQFLGLFRPDTQVGTLSVPILSTPKTKNDFSLDALVPGRIVPGLQSTLQRIVEEVDETPAETTLLDGPEGWTSYRATRGCEVELADKNDRFLRIGLYDRYSRLICGTMTKETEATLQVLIAPATDRVLEMGYQLEFSGQSLHGLRRYLGQYDSTLAQLAVILAERIFSSGQYTPEELGPPKRSVFTRKKRTPLRSRTGEFVLPLSLRNRPISITSTKTLDVSRRLSHPRARSLPPILEISAEKNDKSLEISACFPPRETGTMPLVSVLRDLWAGAVIFGESSKP